MRLSSVSLATLFLFATSSLYAQHSSGGGSSSSGSSSSGGGSHSSSSGGSGYSGGSSAGSSHSSGGGYAPSGGSSHSSGGGYSPSGGSHSAGSSHSSGGGSHSAGGSRSSAGSTNASGGGHSATGGHASGSSSIYRGSGSRGRNDRESDLITTTRNGARGTSEVTRPVHGTRAGVPDRTRAPEKRGFFSVLFHPFRKPHPRLEPKPALYLPRPICPRGHCAPRCPVGQVRSGGACMAAQVPVCMQNQIWNGIDCGQTWRDRCPLGQIWNGFACVQGSVFVDNCLSLRAALQRQGERVQAAASARQNACSFGSAQDCADANIAWQNEENLRQDLMARYRQCQMQSVSSYSGPYDQSLSDSMLWFDSLRFDTHF